MRRSEIIVVCGGILLLHLFVEQSLSQDTSNAPEKVLSRAVELHQKGDLEGAIRQYQAFLTRFPNTGDVRFNLGAAYAALGRYEEAISEYERALELGKLTDSAAVRFNLGWAYFNVADFKNGISVLEALVTVKDSAEARLLLGRCRFHATDYFGALKDLQRALELNPKLPSLNATHGTLLRTMTRHDEADAAFRRELGIEPDDFDSNLYHGIYLQQNEQKYEEALACFNRALQSRPGDLSALFQIGLVYEAMNRADEALETMKRVVEANPDSLEGHVTLTRLYYRRGEKDAAERHRILSERLRGLADGQQLMQKGQFSQALELFNYQKQASPNSAEPYFWAGMALSNMGNWTGAADELTEAARLEPENVKYVIAHANLLVRLGRVQHAAAALSSVDETRLEQLDASLVWLLCDTYHRVGRHDKALRVLELLAKTAPRDPRVDLVRGQILLVQQKFAEARQSLSKSIQKQPAANAAAYSLLGSACYGLKDAAGAKKAFAEAVKQEPDNPEYLKRLATLCLELGEGREAIEYIERAKPAVKELPDIARLQKQAYEAQNEVKPPRR